MVSGYQCDRCGDWAHGDAPVSFYTAGTGRLDYQPSEAARALAGDYCEDCVQEMAELLGLVTRGGDAEDADE